METQCKTLAKMFLLLTLALKISVCVFAENLDETISSNYSDVTTNNPGNGVSVDSIFNEYDGHNLFSGIYSADESYSRDTKCKFTKNN